MDDPLSNLLFSERGDFLVWATCIKKKFLCLSSAEYLPLGVGPRRDKNQRRDKNMGQGGGDDMQEALQFLEAKDQEAAKGQEGEVGQQPTGSNEAEAPEPEPEQPECEECNKIENAEKFCPSCPSYPLVVLQKASFLYK